MIGRLYASMVLDNSPYQSGSLTRTAELSKQRSMLYAIPGSYYQDIRAALTNSAPVRPTVLGDIAKAFRAISGHAYLDSFVH